MLSAGPAGAADDLKLSLPIQCELGKTCFVQHYFDHDPGPEGRDHACGSATYDGHDGIDIRLATAADTQQGVAVVASAGGTVKGTRDGMRDVILSEAGGLASVKGRECGNGVVVDHGGGLETQYCHLLKGSIAVKTGDRVARGQKLGLVGFSGAADFPHVHLTVRKDGKKVDPFTGGAPAGTCSTEAASAERMWDDASAGALTYVTSQALRAGFTSDTQVTTKVRSSATSVPEEPGPASPALLFYALFNNLRGGDIIDMRVTGPGGFAVAGDPKPLDRNKAQYASFAGKKRTAAVWPPGRYDGTASVLRDGAVVAVISSSFEMK